MDIMEIIKQRKSIRRFTPEIPPRSLILECLEAASWAPNPTTQQPWKFIVLSGAALTGVCKIIKENFPAAAARKAQQPAPAISRDAEQMLAARKQEAFSEMMAFLKSSGLDMQAIGEGNFAFHGAPLAVLFAVYPCKDQNFFKATVAAMQNFMLAAAGRGLGTCWMNAVSICQEHIKQELGLPAELIFVDGIAVGYPDGNSPLNKIPRRRLPVDQVTEWRD